MRVFLSLPMNGKTKEEINAELDKMEEWAITEFGPDEDLHFVHIVGYCSKYAMTYYSKFTISPGAFDNCNGKKVPLILFSSSCFNDPINVVGHAILHKDTDGIMAECFLTGSGARRTLSALGIGRLCLNSMANRVNQIVDENGFKRITGGDINAVFIDPAGTVPNHGDVCVWIDWSLF